MPSSIELRARAEETRAEDMLVDGRAAEAVAALERLVAEDGVREVRWTLLVRALVAADRRPDALRAFDRARRTLATELGIPPGVELAAAHDAALRADTSTTGGDDPVVATDELMRAATIQGPRRRRPRGHSHLRGRRRHGAAMWRCPTLRRGGARRRGRRDESGAGRRRGGHDAGPRGARAAAPRPDPDEVAVAGPTQRPAEPDLATVDQRAVRRRGARHRQRPRRTRRPAVALGAIVAVVPDPLRHDERQEWIDQLRALADAHPDEPWRRWVLPLEARESVLAGDIATALDRFGELEADATVANDVVALHAASFGGVLAATTVGDWDAARAAASTSARRGDGRPPRYRHRHPDGGRDARDNPDADLLPAARRARGRVADHRDERDVRGIEIGRLRPRRRRSPKPL